MKRRRGRQSGRWEGAPKPEASLLFSPIWLIEPIAPSPSAFTPHPGEDMEWPEGSKVALAIPINLPGDKKMCNLVLLMLGCRVGAWDA